MFIPKFPINSMAMQVARAAQVANGLSDTEAEKMYQDIVDENQRELEAKREEFYSWAAETFDLSKGLDHYLGISKEGGEHVEIR